MEVRYSTDPVTFRTMDTDSMRKQFLVDSLFTPDTIILVYSDLDRAIIGSAVPGKQTLRLEASKKEMAAEFFTQRRELGVLNIGGTGTVIVDGEKFKLTNKDCLYIGTGNRNIEFSSEDVSRPAKFYLVSYPAHQTYPTRMARKSDAAPVHLGSQEEANKRTIYKCIHREGLQSAQLVLGFTELEPGSVWNTMPPHSHQRRTEIYMYFDLKPAALVCHLMGEPDQTRHIMIHDGQAVISPSWSIHSGCGTSNYTFVWSMGGENQEFDDMDGIAPGDLR